MYLCNLVVVMSVMLRKVFLWACGLFGAVPAISSAQQISEVFSCAGGDAEFAVSGSAYVCLWNMGEPITESFGTREGFDASRKRLTQGFEQGEGYVEDPLRAGSEKQEELGFKLVLYPNPTRGRMQGRLAGKAGNLFQAELRNLSGTTVWRRVMESGNLRLDLTGNPAGIYVLQLTDSRTGKTAVYKIIKAA